MLYTPELDEIVDTCRRSESEGIFAIEDFVLCTI